MRREVGSQPAAAGLRGRPGQSWVSMWWGEKPSRHFICWFYRFL